MSKAEMRELHRLLARALADPNIGGLLKGHPFGEALNLSYAFTASVLDTEARGEEASS